MFTEQQQEEFIEAAEPMIAWLNENTHPHIKVVIDQVGAELLEGVKAYRTFNFVDDENPTPPTSRPTLKLVEKEPTHEHDR